MAGTREIFSAEIKGTNNNYFDGRRAPCQAVSQIFSHRPWPRDSFELAN
jgi:hypothetical protein